MADNQFPDNVIVHHNLPQDRTKYPENVQVVRSSAQATSYPPNVTVVHNPSKVITSDAQVDALPLTQPELMPDAPPSLPAGAVVSDDTKHELEKVAADATNAVARDGATEDDDETTPEEKAATIADAAAKAADDAAAKADVTAKDAAQKAADAADNAAKLADAAALTAKAAKKAAKAAKGGIGATIKKALSPKPDDASGQ